VRVVFYALVIAFFDPVVELEFFPKIFAGVFNQSRIPVTQPKRLYEMRPKLANDPASMVAIFHIVDSDEAETLIRQHINHYSLQFPIANVPALLKGCV